MVSGEESQSDLELIAAINRGDDGAFEALYGQYKDWVFQLAYRFTGNHQDAQDVLQETFAYVVRKFPGFELTSTFKTFLYPAVRNHSISQRKKRKRAVQNEESIEMAVASSEVTADNDDLRRVLHSLPESQQQVLLMRFVEDMTVPEIAAALELPPGTIKSRLHYAIKSLRDSPSIGEHFGRERQ